MDILIGFGVEEHHPIEWVITLGKKLYGLKNEGMAWFKKLKEGLKAIGFVQLQVDP